MRKPNLDKIIEDNLDKTKHIPNKGLTSIPNRKGTIPLVSNDGYKQGIPPQGYNYRIPSDTLYNPTSYRIKATPNVGNPKWLEPYTNQNVEFPGADYVDEQHFQNGGNYISDRAQATQFGQYKRGGGMFPEYHSFAPPRMDEGGKTNYKNLPNVTVNSSQFKRFNRPITESTAIQIFDPVNNKFKSTASSNKLPGKIGKGVSIKDFVKNASAAGSLFPHPYVKIPSMVINAGIGAYDTYNNLKEEDYLNAGINAAGVVPWGAIPKFGIYGKAAEIAGAAADFTNNFGLENKKYGGGLLSRTVTCSNCGWSWKSVDGGKDPMTCHKCGGMIKMKHGGDISIPNLKEGWLEKYL